MASLDVFAVRASLKVYKFYNKSRHTVMDGFINAWLNMKPLELKNLSPQISNHYDSAIRVKLQSYVLLYNAIQVNVS